MNKLVALVVLALSAAACRVTAPAVESSTQALDTVTSVVQVVDTSAGKVLADAQGLTLYTFDHDTSTESTCNGGCAEVWPPLVAPDDRGLAAPLGVITRQDGTRQVTSEGHPLYRFAGDSAQGDVNGDGFQAFHLARPASDGPVTPTTQVDDGAS